MRLPVTDKFLLDLYNGLEGVGRAYDKIRPPGSMYEVVYRDAILLRKEYARKKRKRSFNQFIGYLQTQGYIKIKTLEGTKGVMLTPKGMEKVLRVRRRASDKKKRKDGKWIMIIFDIPEKERKARDFLRDALVDMGYQRLQHSVWVCPYDMYEVTEQAVREYRIIPYIRLFLIEEVT